MQSTAMEDVEAGVGAKPSRAASSDTLRTHLSVPSIRIKRSATAAAHEHDPNSGHDLRKTASLSFFSPPVVVGPAARLPIHFRTLRRVDFLILSFVLLYC